jgi:4-amino-4-deoxy-L-arabinose transferase-like glycosyltransferase
MVSLAAPRRAAWGLAALGLLPFIAVLAFRLAGPLSLDANDQAKQALYALDVRKHGNWILPQERGTYPATKPPLYAWLAAGALAALGDASELGCRIPSVLAFLAIGGLVFRIGAERWSPAAGALAAAAFATSHTAIDLAVQVRPDMLMTALITASYFALHRAEFGHERGMAALFWAGVSLSFLTKGPVAPIGLAAGLAVAWCTPALRAPIRALVCSRWSGLIAVPLIWLVLAALVGETTWLRETVLPELLDKVLAQGTFEGQAVPPGYLVAHLLAKSLPWSVFGVIGVADALRREAPAAQRGYLPASLLLGGMAALSFSRGLRQDYALPFVPLLGLLAAAELVEIRPLSCSLLWRRGALVCSLALGLLAAGVASGIAAVPALRGPETAASLAALALLCLAGWGSRMAVRLDLRPALAGIAALLVLHAVYNSALSPTARSTREHELRAFVREVTSQATERDRVEVVQGVPRSLLFHLGRNQPQVTVDELEAFAPWRPPDGRFLIVLPEADARVLDQRWPDRFRRLTDASLVLLEDKLAI